MHPQSVIRTRESLYCGRRISLMNDRVLRAGPHPSPPAKPRLYADESLSRVPGASAVSDQDGFCEEPRRGGCSAGLGCWGPDRGAAPMALGLTRAGVFGRVAGLVSRRGPATLRTCLAFTSINYKLIASSVHTTKKSRQPKHHDRLIRGASDRGFQ